MVCSKNSLCDWLKNNSVALHTPTHQCNSTWNINTALISNAKLKRIKNSSIISSSTASLPAVSTITDVNPFFLACSIPLEAIPNGSLTSSSLYTSTPTDSPTTFSCSIAAGLYTSQATRRTFFPFDVVSYASFPWGCKYHKGRSLPYDEA